MEPDRQRCTFCHNRFLTNQITGYSPTICEICFRKSQEAEQARGPIRIGDLMPGILRRIFRRNKDGRSQPAKTLIA